MIRRGFASRIFSPDCKTCKYYNVNTKWCKKHNSHQLETRLYENKCGIDGKNYVMKIQTNTDYLEKSKLADIQSFYFYFFMNANAYAMVMTYTSHYYVLFGVFMCSTHMSYLAGKHYREEANMYKMLHLFQEYNTKDKP